MQGLEYLNNLQPWAGRGGFSLKEIRTVMDSLGNPQNKVSSIHVAGTNGKGSTCAMIAAGLGAAGKRVGMNISPHLFKPNERFVIDGKPVTDEWINQYALEIYRITKSLNVTLSFHEAITAVAFLGFSESNLDYQVMEVGLGGRLDASNIIDSEKVAVITSIGYDHQDILGDTLEKIAAEKAGILIPNCRAFIGRMDNEPLNTIKEISLKVGCPTSFISEHYNGSLSLVGEHQRYNAALAKAVLSSLGISNSDIEFGLSTVFWPGRLENAISPNFLDYQFLIDCAHNPDGAETLSNYLSQNSIEKVNLIFGSLETKNWKKSLDILEPYINSIAYLLPDSTRSLSENTIVEYYQNKGIINILDWEKDKIFNYINSLDPNTLILLTGSIYMVGKLRSLLDIADKQIWLRIKK
jgi:dihydrofolate synthase/folylpolyglutamate synthase